MKSDEAASWVFVKLINGTKSGWAPASFLIVRQFKKKFFFKLRKFKNFDFG